MSTSNPCGVEQSQETAVAPKHAATLRLHAVAAATALHLDHFRDSSLRHVVSDPLPFNTPHTSLCLKGQTQSRRCRATHKQFTRAQNVSGRQPLYLRWLPYSHNRSQNCCERRPRCSNSRWTPVFVEGSSVRMYEHHREWNIASQLSGELQSRSAASKRW